jgi:hypothetical protein
MRRPTAKSHKRLFPSQIEHVSAANEFVFTKRTDNDVESYTTKASASRNDESTRYTPEQLSAWRPFKITLLVIICKGNRGKTANENVDLGHVLIY